MSGLQWDHTVHYVNDLEQALRVFRDNGLAAAYGGSHKLWGTHNALSYFGLNYMEFLAVENRELAAGLDTPNLVVKDAVKLLPEHEGFSRVAIRTGNIDATASLLQQQGLDLSPIMEGKRLNTQGQWIEWRMLTISGDYQGLVYPFVIEWKGNDTTRLEELTAAGIVVPHPAGELFGLPAVQDASSADGGESVLLAIGDKLFEFRRGEERQMKQVVLGGGAPGLAGRSVITGNGEYVFAAV
jgi:hypothetical protein